MRPSFGGITSGLLCFACGCGAPSASTDGAGSTGEGSTGGTTAGLTSPTAGLTSPTAGSTSEPGTESSDASGGPTTSSSGGDASSSDVGSESTGDESEGSTGETSLVVEPLASTFFGADRFERIQGVYVDAAGSIYLAGTTHSASFPASAGAFQTTKHGGDGGPNDYHLSEGYVAKLSPDGATVEWATFLGGSARESVYGVRTDSAGNVYAVGATGSADFPTTPGAYDPSVNGPTGGAVLGDTFVVRLSPDGSTLHFGTVVGGSRGNEENCRGSIEIDEENDRLYVSGVTSSPNFPTTAGAFQETYGGGNDDGFVFALSLDGGELLAATYLGGSGSDMAFTEVALAPDGTVLLTGATSSPDFPVTPGAFQTTLASGSAAEPWYVDGDAWVARLSPGLDDVIFASYLGGSGSDAGGHNQGMGVDSQGRLVLAGTTSSPDFPVTAGAFRGTAYGGADGFVAVVSADGSQLDHSTYIGGTADENLSTMFVDADDRVLVTGIVSSDDWPTTGDAMQATFGNTTAGGGVTDAVLTIFDPTLGTVEYSTYLGGAGSISGGERGRSIWVRNNVVSIVGATDSADFPVLMPALQATYGGGVDGFLMQFEMSEVRR